MDSIKINWEKFREAFSKISYFTFDENISDNDLKPKFLLSDDKKEAMEASQQMIDALPQINTWKYPLEKMNPDIIAMILNLNERLSRIENDYKHRIEILEQNNIVIKSIFTEKDPEPPDENGTLEELEIIYYNNHKEANQEEFKLPDEAEK